MYDVADPQVMISRIHWNDEWYQVNFDEELDISISIHSEGPQCFHSGKAKIRPQKIGDFVGSTKLGGIVNSYEVCFLPHAHGTHTECSAHIGLEDLHITDVLAKSHFISQLITVQPKTIVDGDQIIDQDLIRKYLDHPVAPAIIIRTRPNDDSKRGRNYTGSNPPYFHHSVLGDLADLGVQHFLTDLPSIDRENDGGALLAHKAFWKDPNQRKTATITEMIFADSSIEDGFYLLNLQVASFALDASPSRPILYRLTHTGSQKLTY